MALVLGRHLRACILGPCHARICHAVIRCWDSQASQKALDASAETIGKNNDESDVSRKELVEITRAFRADASEVHTLPDSSARLTHSISIYLLIDCKTTNFASQMVAGNPEKGGAADQAVSNRGKADACITRPAETHQGRHAVQAQQICRERVLGDFQDHCRGAWSVIVHTECWNDDDDDFMLMMIMVMMILC